MVKLKLYFESMAGIHLRDAVRALRDSGSAETLYDSKIRAADPGVVDHTTFSIARDEAEGERVSFSRWALLFAAFAAEGYANDFLYEQRDGQDREVLQRLSTVDKFVLLSELAGRKDLLSRDREPMQTIKWLFQRRDELVHARPRGEDLTYHPRNHNPRRAARCVVAVADAACRLFDDEPSGAYRSRVLVGGRTLIEYGGKAADVLPDLHAEPSALDLV